MLKNKLLIKNILIGLAVTIFFIAPSILITGWMVGVGAQLLILLWLAGFGGLVLLTLSGESLVWLMVGLVLVVVGQVMYFVGFNQIIWVPYCLALIMYLRFPLAYANSPYVREKRLPSPALVKPVMLFIGMVFVSIVVNQPPAIQAIVAAKNQIFLFSLFFLVTYCAVNTSVIEKIFKFLPWVALFQVPLVLYQYFFIASKRSNLGGAFGVSWDAIVGGFGGDPMAGGASGTMAWFQVAVATLCLAWYKRQLISKWILAGVLGAAFISIAIAEVKVVVVLFPLATIALLLPYLKSRPVVAIMGVFASIATMIGVLIIYSYLYGAGTGNADIASVVEDAFWYSLDPTFINLTTGEMGRLAAVVHWWQNTGFTDFLHTLFGYGPGASRTESAFGAGELGRRFPFNIDRSTASALLWDIGLFGLLSFLFLITYASQLAFRLSKSPTLSAFSSSSLEAISGILLTLVVMVFYGKDVIEVPALGVMVMLFFGYVSLMNLAVFRNNKKTKAVVL